MIKSQIESITDSLIHNIAGIRFGSVSVTLTIHDGRITTIIHSVTANTREGTK